MPSSARAFVQQKSATNFHGTKRRTHGTRDGLAIVAGFGLVAFLAVILFQNRSEPTSNAANQEPIVPQQEAAFCSIANNASSQYHELAAQASAAHNQKNGIVGQRLSTEMTSVYRTRNQDVFQLLGKNGFNFEGWQVTLEQIYSVDQTSGKLHFIFHPTCSPITTIHADASSNSTSVELLSRKGQGDQLIVSGIFVQPFGKPAIAPIDPQKFEQSFTEAGSMSAPEYSAVVRILNE